MKSSSIQNNPFVQRDSVARTKLALRTVLSPASSTIKTLEAIASGGMAGVTYQSEAGKCIAYLHGKRVAQATFVSGLSEDQQAAQQRVFKSLCEGHFQVRENPAREQDPTCRNAQYINALKQTIYLKDGTRIVAGEHGKADRLTIFPADGGPPHNVEIAEGTPVQGTIDFTVGGREIERIDNDSRSLGLCVKSAHATFEIGECEETFSIQSISKVFADIALALCEPSLYRNLQGEVVAVFNLRHGGRVQVPEDFKPLDKPVHNIPVKSAYSPFLFNQRGNLIKVRADDHSTSYEIYNASNNYGALTTTGRLPEKAIIDGRTVEGAENIVAAVMLGLSGADALPAVNQPVLDGELSDTYSDHEAFVIRYQRVYAPLKTAIKGKNPELWKIADAAGPNDPGASDDARTLARVLTAIKDGKFGSGLQELALKGAWPELSSALVELANTDWKVFKQLLELSKLHFPDNFTRALWLTSKGAFGEEYRHLVANLQVEGTASRTSEIVEVAEAVAKAEQIMRAYTTHCAFNVSCKQLADMSFPIASGGQGPQGERLINPHVAHEAQEQMLNGGLYNESGKVPGLQKVPTKSGVGGGLMVALAHGELVNMAHEQAGVSIYALNLAYERLYGNGGVSAGLLSRPLNAAGNSADGLEVERLMVQTLVDQLVAEARAI